MLNSLDRDQARHSVAPDLGPNILLKLSADDTRRQRGKHLFCKLATIKDNQSGDLKISSSFMLFVYK